jgi:hypothetical protein
MSHAKAVVISALVTAAVVGVIFRFAPLRGIVTGTTNTGPFVG